MTSSQPVITPNALNFTPDNKQCYAYSGEVTLGASANKNYLEFNTNSEYVIGYVIPHGSPDGAWSSDFSLYIYFNDVIIYSNRFLNNSNAYNQGNAGIRIIVPPFTNVKLNLKNEESGTTVQMGIVFTGEAVGMTDTGYQ